MGRNALINTDFCYNFIVIAESRSITAAAARLNIAQPALSNQVKTLESAFGTKLLIRNPRSVELTDAGRLFYQACRNICLLEETLHKEMEGFLDGRRGVLKLGITPSLPDGMIEGILADFTRRNPDVICQLYEVSTGDLFDLLEHGVIELAVVRSPKQTPAVLRVLATIDEHFYAFRRHDCPWLADKKNAISLADLRDVPLSLPRGFSAFFSECCIKNDFEPRVQSVSTSRNATLMWAEQGAAVAVLSLPANDDWLDGSILIRHHISDKGLETSRSLVSIREQPLSLVAERFADIAKQVFSHNRDIPQIN